MSMIRTPNLEIDDDDTGPRDRPVVLLLHGWPDERPSRSEVAAALSDAGLRTVTPPLQGFGATRFLPDATPRTGSSAVLPCPQGRGRARCGKPLREAPREVARRLAEQVRPLEGSG